MSEMGVRLLIVLAVVAVVAGSIWLLRRRGAPSESTIDQVLLGPGVYLFTSATCAECEPARNALVGALGHEGFEEFSWESHPRLFEELEISAVPSTLVVDDSRQSTLYPGPAAAALDSLSP